MRGGRRGEKACVAARVEQIHALLQQFAAVHFKDAHLQTHLLRMVWHDGKRIGHVLGVERGQLDRSLGLRIAGHLAAQNHTAPAALPIHSG